MKSAKAHKVTATLIRLSDKEVLWRETIPTWGEAINNLPCHSIDNCDDAFKSLAKSAADDLDAAYASSK